MTPRWFNLYGPHPLDRKNQKERVKGRREGSFWLGRVLTAMNLVPNDAPQLGAYASPIPLSEPKTDNFRLLVDIYELTGFDIAKPG